MGTSKEEQSGLSWEVFADKQKALDAIKQCRERIDSSDKPDDKQIPDLQAAIAIYQADIRARLAKEDPVAVLQDLQTDFAADGLQEKCSAFWEGNLYRMQTICLYLSGDYTAAIESTQKFIDFINSIYSHSWQIPGLLLDTANSYRKLSNMENAIEYARKAEKYADQHRSDYNTWVFCDWADDALYRKKNLSTRDSLLLIGELVSELGGLSLIDQQDIDQGWWTPFKRAKTTEQLQNFLSRMRTAASQEEDLLRRANLSIAVQVFACYKDELQQKLTSLYEVTQDSPSFDACQWYWRMWVFYIIGSTHLENKQYPEALENLQKSLDLIQRNNPKSENHDLCLSKIALAYEESGDLQSAIRYANQAVVICSESEAVDKKGYQELIARRLEALAALHEKASNTEQAEETRAAIKDPRSTIMLLQNQQQWDQLIGLDDAKQGAQEIAAFCSVQNARQDKPRLSRLLSFTGDPQRGKKHVVGILSRLLYGLKQVDTPDPLVVDAAFLIDNLEILERGDKARLIYVEDCEQLFEQNLASDNQVFKRLQELLQEKDRLNWIVFGGRKEFLDLLENQEYSFSECIDYSWNFPDYTQHQLADLFVFLAGEKGYIFSEQLHKNIPLIISEAQQSQGNTALDSGDLKNILSRALQQQAVRLTAENKLGNQEEINILQLQDVVQKGDDRGEVLEGSLADLDELIGLKNVKQRVAELSNLMAVRSRRKQQGLTNPQRNNHLIFTGPPGTGKTTVARIIAQLMYSTGQIKSDHLVEATASDLVAGYIGQTAIKTRQLVERARGGVLFIDEAYTLGYKSETSGGYASEALAELIKLMEDYREDMIIILAGYHDEMQSLLAVNPGLKSRIADIINFPSYSSEELQQICRLIVEKSSYHLSAEADLGIKAPCDLIQGLSIKDCGNARDVRNLVESMILHQSSRIKDQPDADLSLIESADIQWKPKNAPAKPENKIGFT